MVRCPIASKTGWTLGLACSGPDSRITSLPCSAGSLVPRTGASTKSTPRRFASPMHRWVASSPMVLICSQTAWSISFWLAITGSAPSSPSMASKTALASASMVSTMVASCAALAGVSVTMAPSLASGSALSRERFQTRTFSPARAMFRAIAKPMVPPAPRTATVSVARTATVLVARAERSADFWLRVMPVSLVFGSGDPNSVTRDGRGQPRSA